MTRRMNIKFDAITYLSSNDYKIMDDVLDELAIQLEDGGYIFARDLYLHYVEACEELGKLPATSIAFGKRASSHERLKRRRSPRGNIYLLNKLEATEEILTVAEIVEEKYKDGKYIYGKDLYELYLKECKKNNVEPLNLKGFGLRIRSVKFIKKARAAKGVKYFV